MNPNPNILIPVSRLEKNTLKKIAFENERNDLNESFQNNFEFVRINESDLHYLSDELTKKYKIKKIKLVELKDLWNSSNEIRAMFGVNR